MPRITYALVVALALTACSVNNGHALTDAQVNQFTPGRSTLANVQSALGPPTNTTTNSDGTTELVYQWGSNTASGQSYIPVVGPFIAKSTYTGSTVTYLFGRNGVLQNVKRENENRPQSM